jgi:hypothetical protein
VKEQRPETTPVEATYLPNKTRGFVQLAFAHGAADVLDERKKWLLARYVVDDQLTLEELKQYAGVTSLVTARQLYQKALIRVWKASSLEAQQQFPIEKLIKGKSRGRIHEKSPETKAKMGEAQRERRKREREERMRVIFENLKSQNNR